MNENLLLLYFLERSKCLKSYLKFFNHRGENIPYYHFTYEGEFYKYLRIRNNKLLGNGTRINEFFVKKSFEQYEFNSDYYIFPKAVMIIIHYFDDLKNRDLDNNSYKPLIDGIKKTGIIEDDSWQNLSIMLIGSINKSGGSKEKIETILVPSQHFITFLSLKILSDNLFKSHQNISLKKE